MLIRIVGTLDPWIQRWVAFTIVMSKLLQT